MLAHQPHAPGQRLRAGPGDTGVDPRTVDTYIRYLRRKLGDDAILTVRNLGYRFRG